MSRGSSWPLLQSRVRALLADAAYIGQPAPSAAAIAEYLGCSVESVALALNPSPGGPAWRVGHGVLWVRAVHDPSIDDAGIVGPRDDGLYWITLLVDARTLANRSAA